MKHRLKRFVCAGLIFSAVAFCTKSFSQVAPRSVPAHLPTAARFDQPLGRLPTNQQLSAAISLPFRNRAALSNLFNEINNPASPKYHHYLSREEFTERFGPTEEDYSALKKFAVARGLRIGEHANRMLLEVSGTVGDIERAFHTTLWLYQHPTEARTFYAPETEPSLDVAVPVLSVRGLDNYALARPRLQSVVSANAQNALPNSGSGPGGGYLGNDFRAAYVPDTTLTGAGQVVGLVQFDGYSPADISYYETQAGLPSVTLSNILLNGASGNPSGTGGEIEVSLDIEAVIAMAPGLDKVMVYIAPNPTPFEVILNRMVSDNAARQLSCSWFIPRGEADSTAEQIFQEMAIQGQSFFNASGDYDAYTGLIDFPSDSPNITQVGGTTLATTGAGGARVSEAVWNRNNGMGSGGGISTQYPIPTWQTNIDMSTNQGSTTMRNVPDVSLTAENIYVRVNGLDLRVGGTSGAAPLWAGFAALVNEEAAANSQPPIGFINPAVNKIASGTNYASCFFDITAGDNTKSSSPTKFFATTGYDLCTGWGTPAGQRLIDVLAFPEPLRITPSEGFSSAGGAGGPFTITSQKLTLTNIGTNALDWTLVNSAAWLDASLTNGTLNAGASVIVTVSLNSVASNLVVGTYNATLWFTNLNTQASLESDFSLSVLSPPDITNQPVDMGVPDGGTATFSVAATGSSPLDYHWQFNGTNLDDGGKFTGVTTTNLIVTDVSAGETGVYTIVITNLAGSITSSNAFLSITDSAPIITIEPADQSVVASGTATFMVSAIGSRPFYFQWTYGGLGGTNIDGATNDTLVLTNVQMPAAGIYGVTVTNMFGSTPSSNAMLTVTGFDHFGWSAIPSPQFVNAPFAVTVVALDTANAVVTDFSGTVTLGSTNGVTVNPQVSGNFVNGVWSGSLSVTQVVSGLVLQASDGDNRVGFANTIDVVIPPSLGIANFGTSMLLSWPADPGGFVLEVSGSLAPDSWAAYPDSPLTFNGQNLQSVPVTETNQFFRLRFVGP